MYSSMDKSSNIAYTIATVVAALFFIIKPEPILMMLGVGAGMAAGLVALALWLAVLAIPVLIALALIKYLRGGRS